MYTLQNSIQTHAFSAFRLSNSTHVNWHLLPRWHSKGRRSPLNAPSICDWKDQLLASRLWRLLPQLKLNLLKFWKGPYTLSGDAVRVVLEKVWTWQQGPCLFQTTRHQSLLRLLTVDPGTPAIWESERTYFAPKWFKEIGFFATFLVLNFQQILELKVLSFEKFQGHKRLMGMFMGNDEKKGEKESGGVLSKAEKAKKARKAIILVAQMAIAKGQNDDQIQLWQPSFPLQTFSDPTSGPPFFLSSSWFLRLGCWLELYFLGLPFIRTSAESPWLSRRNVVPRPSFLFHSVPPEDRHRENISGVLLPRRSGGSRSSSMAAGPSSAAIGSSSAVAGPSSAAVGSSSAAADPSCALVALRALPLDLRAGPSRAGRSLSTAAGSTSATAGSSGAQTATEGENSNSGARRRHQGTRTREYPLFVTPNGQSIDQ